MRRNKLTLSAFAGLIIWASACGAGQAPLPTPQAGTRAVFSAFSSPSGDIDEAFDNLSRMIRESPREVESSAQYYLDDADPNVRLAAIYALANTATSDRALDALRVAMDDPDLTSRLLAAAGLVTGGVKDGIPVLIEGLRSNQALAYSQPPMRAWQYAQSLLVLYIDQDLGLLGAEDFVAARAAAEAWERWWQRVGGDVKWHASEEEYRWESN